MVVVAAAAAAVANVGALALNFYFKRLFPLRRCLALSLPFFLGGGDLVIGIALAMWCVLGIVLVLSVRAHRPLSNFFFHFLLLVRLWEATSR